MLSHSTLYLSGPMTGLPEFNFPAFNAAAKHLRMLGMTIINPAEMDDGNTSLPWGYYIRRDIKKLMECDGVVVLEGWQKSKGCNVELTIARMLDMKILSYPSLEPLHETALAEAERLVHGDRNKAYGHPKEDFGRTARIWSVILGIEVKPEQVALCMIGVKISREINQPKRDNRVDICGYAETLEMIHQAKG